MEEERLREIIISHFERARLLNRVNTSLLVLFINKIGNEKFDTIYGIRIPLMI